MVQNSSNGRDSGIEEHADLLQPERTAISSSETFQKKKILPIGGRISISDLAGRAYQNFDHSEGRRCVIEFSDGSIIGGKFCTAFISAMLTFSCKQITFNA